MHVLSALDVYVQSFRYHMQCYYRNFCVWLWLDILCWAVLSRELRTEANNANANANASTPSRHPVSSISFASNLFRSNEHWLFEGPFAYHHLHRHGHGHRHRTPQPAKHTKTEEHTQTGPQFCVWQKQFARVFRLFAFILALVGLTVTKRDENTGVRNPFYLFFRRGQARAWQVGRWTRGGEVELRL